MKSPKIPKPTEARPAPPVSQRAAGVEAAEDEEARRRRNRSAWNDSILRPGGDTGRPTLGY